jgi:hypothetical protein
VNSATTCYCGGGDPHPWMSIPACSPSAPQTMLGAHAEAEAARFELRAASARLPFVRRWYERRVAVARRIAREELGLDA